MKSEMEAGKQPCPEGLKKKKHRHSKLLIATGLAGAVVFAANAAMAVKYNYDFGTPNTPAGIMKNIKGIPTEWIYTIDQLKQDIEFDKKTASETFDREKDNQVMQAGVNASPFSLGDLPALLKKNTVEPIEYGSIPNIRIFNPIKLAEDQKIEISNIYSPETSDPITGRVNREPMVTSKNFLIHNKGTEIIVPVGGAEVFLATPYEVKGKPHFNGVIIQFNGPDETKYSLLIDAPDDIRQLLPMDIIKDAQEKKEGMKGVSVPAGATVLKTNMDNASIRIRLSFKYPPYSRAGFCGFNLITDSQEGKVLYIPSDTDN